MESNIDGQIDVEIQEIDNVTNICDDKTREMYYDEYVHSLGTIDIDEYEFADVEKEQSNVTNLLNIFMCYYKQLYNEKQSSSMIDNIEYERDENTNKCMEFFYHEILKFNESDDKDKNTLHSPDDDSINIDECNELYTLYIDSEPIYVCKYVLPLAEYLSKEKWNELEWSIIPLKTMDEL